MSAAGTMSREVTRAWASAAVPPSSAAVAMVLEANGGDRLNVSFSSCQGRPAALEGEAAGLLAAVLDRLSPSLQALCAVEAGEVSSRLRRGSSETLLFSRRYRVASCRGMVLGCQDAGDTKPFASPWTGTLDPDEADSSLPVALAPSAVLALVSYALEVTGSHLETGSDAEIPGITVLDTASSPYPPQHHPFAGDGSPSPDRRLIDDGRWSNREEHAGDDVDPLFFLVTRPDRALRPLAAATRFSRRNLAVTCSRTAPTPSPAAILVDSWRVRVGPRSGPVPFDAWLSLAGCDGERLAFSSSFTLKLDPWAALAGIQGACGPVAPAVDEDPIEGDSYGSAPTLVTALTLADLAGSGRSA